jgi:phosphotransferase system  glucose/maltose/N-acetylglucosamine-specific IIC component
MNKRVFIGNAVILTASAVVLRLSGIWYRAFICGQIMKLGGFSELTSQSYSNSVMISLSLIAIYTLYFMATYLIAKRNIINERL